MIASCTFVIYMLGDDNWQIGKNGPDQAQLDTVDMPTDAPPDIVANQLSVALNQLGYAGQGITLAVPSRYCLCASISKEGLTRNNARQAMVFRLEEKLPIAVEEVVTDFVPGNGHALGVCVQTQKLAPIVESLENLAVRIDLICPTALLALQHKMDQTQDEDCDTFLWGHDQQLELFALADRKPVAWHLIFNDNDLQVKLNMLALRQTQPLRLAACGLANETRDRISTLPDVQIILDDDQSMPLAAAAAADQIALGKRKGWINLHRDDLAVTDTLTQIRNPLIAASVGAALFLVCLCIVLLWRANHYKQISLEVESQQKSLYLEMYPKSDIPLNIKSRLASEQRKSAALRGDHSKLPKQAPVLLMLRDALSNLPKNIRYQILELQFDEGKVYLEGQVRSHSDAEAIAAALNKTSSLNMDPPRTENLSKKGVSFTIRGTTVYNTSTPHAGNSRTR